MLGLYANGSVSFGCKANAKYIFAKQISKPQLSVYLHIMMFIGETPIKVVGSKVLILDDNYQSDIDIWQLPKKMFLL
jgi:hypothetical protein